MINCWSFLFPERPIPDEINPLSRTQVPLLFLVYGVLSYHCKFPKVKYSELAGLWGSTHSRGLPTEQFSIQTYQVICDVIAGAWGKKF